MSNIDYLRQLHHKKWNFERAQFRVREFYSYEKDLVFRFCVKDLILIYYVHEKSVDFGSVHFSKTHFALKYSCDMLDNNKIL